MKYKGEIFNLKITTCFKSKMVQNLHARVLEIH